MLFTCQFLASEFIGDVPSEVAIQLQRREFINEKVIELLEDEDFGEDEQDDEEEDKASDGKKLKKIKTGLNAFPVLVFPIDPNDDVWPEPLIKVNDAVTSAVTFRDNPMNQPTSSLNR